MKKKISLGLLIVGFLMATMAVWAKDEPNDINSKNYHLAMVQKYENLASDQDAIIRKHQKMKTYANENSKFYERMGFQAASVNSINKIAKHCDAIIKDASKLKANYEDFAKWHRTMTAESNGKTGK